MSCSFNQDWVKEFLWLEPVEGDRSRGRCRPCQSTISVKKGRFDVNKHGKNTTHLRNQAAETAPNPFTGQTSKQSTIAEALKKSQNMRNKQQESKDGALKFEFGLSLAAANHNIAGGFVDCVISLVKKNITDSQMVKEIKMSRDKSSYILENSIAPNLEAKVLGCMKRWPYSLNYDESVVGKKSQCALNASFRNEKNRIQKAHLTTLEMEESVTGKYTCKKVYDLLEEKQVPKKHQVSDQTDGCGAMLGKYEGCHEYAKKEVPTLPDLGGCGCHDPSNAIKNGLAAMMSKMTTLYKSIYANLEKHSILKNRQFQEVSLELGLIFKHVPRFVDVRFRYVPLLAKYMIDNDRALYRYYSELYEQVRQDRF